jgi:hypothetical protein
VRDCRSQARNEQSKHLEQRVRQSLCVAKVACKCFWLRHKNFTKKARSRIDFGTDKNPGHDIAKVCFSTGASSSSNVLHLFIAAIAVIDFAISCRIATSAFEFRIVNIVDCFGVGHLAIN